MNSFEDRQTKVLKEALNLVLEDSYDRASKCIRDKLGCNTYYAASLLSDLMYAREYETIGLKKIVKCMIIVGQMCVAEDAAARPEVYRRVQQ